MLAMCLITAIFLTGINHVDAGKLFSFVSRIFIRIKKRNYIDLSGIYLRRNFNAQFTRTSLIRIKYLLV